MRCCKLSVFVKYVRFNVGITFGFGPTICLPALKQSEICIVIEAIFQRWDHELKHSMNGPVLITLKCVLGAQDYEILEANVPRYFQIP